METWNEKLERLRLAQRQRDAARQSEQPLQPSGMSHDQAMKLRRVREETTATIQAEVRAMSDRDPICPIQKYRDDLASKMKHAGYSEKNAIRERLKILDAHLAEKAAEKAEAKRLADFAADPLVINVRTAAETLRSAPQLYPDVPAAEIEKLKVIAHSPDFLDASHLSQTFFSALEAVENMQLAKNEERHAAQAADVAAKQAELTEATNRMNESKARLTSVGQSLGRQEGEPNADPGQ